MSVLENVLEFLIVNWIQQVSSEFKKYYSILINCLICFQSCPRSFRLCAWPEGYDNRNDFKIFLNNLSSLFILFSYITIFRKLLLIIISVIIQSELWIKLKSNPSNGIKNIIYEIRLSYFKRNIPNYISILVKFSILVLIYYSLIC